MAARTATERMSVMSNMMRPLFWVVACRGYDRRPPRRLDACPLSAAGTNRAASGHV
jgi:hypothetical protein